jgi:hypothetical protein
MKITDNTRKAPIATNIDLNSVNSSEPAHTQPDAIVVARPRPTAQITSLITGYQAAVSNQAFMQPALNRSNTEMPSPSQRSSSLKRRIVPLKPPK